ncbi:metal-dependent hydrolase [Candidatus Woesearchaeota archaeon]|nr:metal-dependent hydrolase [Candidatus Woesearchaeota archaeon]
MLPQTHFLTAFLIGTLFYNLNLISIYLLFIIGILAVLIDIDHLINYLRKKKRLSVKETWNNSSRINERSFIHSLKGIVLIFILTIILLGFYPKIAIIIGISYFSHIFVDQIPKNPPFIKVKIFNFNLDKKLSYLEIGIDLILLVSIIVIFYL